MKKAIIIILVVLIVVVLLTVIFFKYGSFGNGCPPPDKPKNVPLEAVLKGGCDGGNWIELVEIKEDKCRFRIYRDWNGALILDADFKYVNCNGFRLTKSNWVDHVAYFGEAIEFFDKPGINDRCRLEPVYPAYYEESLE
jgi:hypothetical protein